MEVGQAAGGRMEGGSLSMVSSPMETRDKKFSIPLDHSGVASGNSKCATNLPFLPNTAVQGGACVLEESGHEHSIQISSLLRVIGMRQAQRRSNSGPQPALLRMTTAKGAQQAANTEYCKSAAKTLSADRKNISKRGNLTRAGRRQTGSCLLLALSSSPAGPPWHVP